MRRSRSRLIHILCIIGSCSSCVTATAADQPVTHGRQVIIDRGIQVQSVVLGWDGIDADRALQNFSDLGLWRSAGFTTFNLWTQPDSGGTVFSQLKPMGQQWGQIWGDPPPPSWPANNSPPDGASSILNPYEQDDITNLVDVQWSYERRNELFNPAPTGELCSTNPVQAGHLCPIKSLFRLWNQQYPGALAHTNFCEPPHCSTGLSDAQLTQYINVTHADILTLDQYPPSYSPSGGDYSAWYAATQKYRLHALAGYTTDSGTNSGPLPYGQFMKAFRDSYAAEPINESFVNLQQFASLAFGYTWLFAYIYTAYAPPGQPLYPALFYSGRSSSSPGGDQHPDPAVFLWEQNPNRQTLNLSNYFKRAVSTGVFYMPDVAGLQCCSVAPSNMARWSAHAGAIPGVADDYITSIISYTASTANQGVPDFTHGHVIIGYFMPLQFMRDHGRAFANGLHLIIVNGNAGGGVTADQLGQWCHVVFDFTGSSNNSLLTLDRTTGKVELLPLVSLGGNQYYGDIFLAGGVGDVFTFWDSSQPIPGMQDKASIVPVIAPLLLH